MNRLEKNILIYIYYSNKIYKKEKKIFILKFIKKIKFKSTMVKNYKSKLISTCPLKGKRKTVIKNIGLTRHFIRDLKWKPYFDFWEVLSW